MPDQRTSNTPANGPSRRAFLRDSAGTALGSAAALGLAGRALADEPPSLDTVTTLPPDPSAASPSVSITMTLNGKQRALDLDPRATLLDTLRTNLGLTGAKKGCDHGACGACTCHVDGRAVLGCLTLAATLDGKTVTSIEGLEHDGELHELQKQFVRCDGYQCGYCTPGQIMSGVANIGEGRVGSEAEIREYMSGNLCRCGAYVNIVEAVKSAAAKQKGVA